MEYKIWHDNFQGGEQEQTYEHGGEGNVEEIGFMEVQIDGQWNLRNSPFFIQRNVLSRSS